MRRSEESLLRPNPFLSEEKKQAGREPKKAPHKKVEEAAARWRSQKSEKEMGIKGSLRRKRKNRAYERTEVPARNEGTPSSFNHRGSGESPGTVGERGRERQQTVLSPAHDFWQGLKYGRRKRGRKRGSKYEPKRGGRRRPNGVAFVQTDHAAPEETGHAKAGAGSY